MIYNKNLRKLNGVESLRITKIVLQHACACLIFQIRPQYQQSKTRSNPKMVNIGLDIGVRSFS